MVLTILLSNIAYPAVCPGRIELAGSNCPNSSEIDAVLMGKGMVTSVGIWGNTSNTGDEVIDTLPELKPV